MLKKRKLIQPADYNKDQNKFSKKEIEFLNYLNLWGQDSEDSTHGGSLKKEAEKVEKKKNNDFAERVVVKKYKTDRGKYKTEMCRQWSRTQNCSYGHKCQFAHGPHELISKSTKNPMYKSKKCKTFHSKYACPYGLRCKFIHENRTIKKIVKHSFYQHKLQLLKPSSKKTRTKRRLRVFSRLTKSKK